MGSDQIGRLQEALAGRYRFDRELGQGAFASVFLARDLRLERSVAIKVLHIDPTSEISEIRFLQEIRYLAGLQHPNIVPVHDSGHLENLLYYVMPHVRGESLRERIRRQHQLPVPDAIHITCELADALECAHNAGIIHRDIKPENILFSGSHPMLADFGVARAINASRDKKLTKPGFGSPGTPAYMSPEQMLGDRELDRRADIYSLGCVLYEMLTGQAPFEGAGGFVKRFTEPPPSVRSRRPEVSQTVDRVLTRALGRTPEERFQSAAEVADALAHSPELAVVSPDRAETEIPPSIAQSTLSLQRSRIHEWVNRRPRLPWQAVVGGIAALLIVLGARPAIGYFRHSPPPATASDPRRVAVFDFEDQSPEHSLGHIASGLAVSLTQELSGLNALQVLSRNSVRSFRDKGIAVDSIARALRVGTLIEGSVQRSNNKLRLTVQVVDAQSNAQIETATLERSMGELFLLEDDLAHQVALIFRRRLGIMIRVHETIAGTTSSRARELVFRADKLREEAEVYAASPNASDFTNAQTRLGSADSLLSLAEKADPTWIAPVIDRGWVALSLAQAESSVTRQKNFNLAIDHANRALSRDKGNPSALELRGTALYWEVVRVEMSDSIFSDRLTHAAADLDNALAADSSLAAAWGTLSLVRFARGDLTAAAAAGRTALAMDTFLKDAPRILAALFTAALVDGSFSDAARWCDAGARDYPQDPRFVECQLTLLAEDNTKSPDLRKAWGLLMRANAIDPPAHAREPYVPIYRQMMVAMVLARAGERDSAQSVARRARNAIASDSSLHIDFIYDDAYLSLLLGKPAETVRMLAEYLTARPSLRSLVSRHHRWNQIRNDPDFLALVRSTKKG